MENLTEIQEKTENELKKEFLNSYQEAKRALKRLGEQLAEVKISKISPGCQIGDGMPHSSSISDLSDYAVRVDEIEQKIIKARYQRILTLQLVQARIEAMTDEREKDLLTYRYIKGFGWEKIAVKMNYTWRHTLRMHGKALENFKVS